jgi:FixJ family two-component response regulator
MPNKPSEQAEATVFVVDDDPAVRDSVIWLLESVGLRVESFASAQAFLDCYEPSHPGCLLLDLRMPGMSGLELQQRLAARQALLPILFITGHGDVPTAVRALQSGAIDFILKPFNDQALLDRVQRALADDARRRERLAHRAEIAARLDSLTPRESEVMRRVVEGKANKVVGLELGISEKTVEVHRSNVMQKMQARSLADLIRFSLELEYPHDGADPASDSQD